MTTTYSIRGFFLKLKALIFGRSKIAILFEALKKDPSNMDITNRIKQEFFERPLDVIAEVVHRASQAHRKAEPRAEIPVSIDTMRRTWENTIHRERVQPLRYFTPTTRGELIDIIQDAEKKGLLVRAVGMGHSFSDVANATDYLVDMLSLKKALPLETDTLKAGLGTLYNCEAGTLVQQINADLDALGLALPTMAAFDQETIYGAIATSTHGTGIRVPGMSAMVRSIDLIAGGGTCCRLEPTNGITDPARFRARYPDGSILLIQDDDKFYSAVVGFGMMGIVYSLVIEPVKSFYLLQRLWVTTWEVVKAKMESRKFFIETDVLGGTVTPDPVTGEYPPSRAQVFVNPYLTKNFWTKKETHTCVVQVQTSITKEEYTELQKKATGEPKSKILAFIADLISNGQLGYHEASIDGEDDDNIVEELSIDGLLYLLNSFPTLTPIFLDISMLVLLSGSGKFGKSYIVMNQGKLAVKNSGYSVEPGLPVDAANSFIKGAEEIIRVAGLSAESLAFLTSPMCMRFVKKSDDYMSPEYLSDTCMTDVPLMLGTVGDNQMLDRLQVNLLALGARPHWGKICNLVNGKDLIHEMYPKFDTFLNTVTFFNPKGTFNGRFSYRTGISTMPFGG